MKAERWRSIGIRSYRRRIPQSYADAYVFGSHHPMCLWAWSVYSAGRQDAGVTNSFLHAKMCADEALKGVVEGRR